ncbi:nucleotide sugar dehydrogenase [Micrococcaceae sp. AOP34-BR2-30]
MTDTTGQQLAVVIGQGYVGLPLAQAMSASGVRTIGFDVSSQRISALNSGISHVDDLSDQALQIMLANGYSASADPSVIAQADVVVICVPTPLDDGGGPDLGAVESATRTIASNLGSGTLVILESTTYPGTTEGIVLPLLEEHGAVHGRDFHLAFSPERVDPGSKTHGITNTPKLVGGLNAEATELATAFYEQFIEVVVPLSGAKEAETAKLLENTYRHVNIALVNEMARFCHDLDIDIWEVIRGAATKPFGFQKFTPGPGVGGHCIPIDPNYLSFQVKKTLGYQFRFVELAQEINNSMPQYVVTRLTDLLNDHGKPLNGSNVLLLGVTYKPDIADQRESPAVPLVKILRDKKADVVFHDPLVEEWHVEGETLTRVPDLDAALEQADLVVLMQAHQSYDIEKLSSRSALFFDTRGVSAETGSVHRL